MFWIKQVEEMENMERNRVQLNLQINKGGVLECQGRIQRQNPIYLPDCHAIMAKIVNTLYDHQNINTDGKQFRRLVRKVIKSCNGCYWFPAIAYATPPPGKLPVNHTKGSKAFKVVGVDFTGLLKYRKSKKQEGKAYLIVCVCSLTHALHLKDLTMMETMEFLGSLKRLMDR